MTYLRTVCRCGVFKNRTWRQPAVLDSLTGMRGASPLLLALSSQSRPTQSEARAWLAAARAVLGVCGLALLGLNPQSVQDWLAGAPIRPALCRLIWHAWSLTHCPSNLSTFYHWATWGRFNADMPQDYRGQAIRLLNRKTGPTRAARPRIKADGKPERVGAHWKKSAALRRAYVVPGCGLPPMLG